MNNLEMYAIGNIVVMVLMTRILVKVDETKQEKAEDFIFQAIIMIASYTIGFGLTLIQKLLGVI